MSGSASTPRTLGAYELLFELARGGMAAVWVARRRGAHGFHRLVAVKLLHDAASAPDLLRAFLAEARVTARIAHGNVVPTLDLGEQDGTPFLAMELVRGVALVKLLARLQADGEESDFRTMCWIAAEAAEGLHAAHELCDDAGRPLGLVHRDVSPQNLLLSVDGRVQVADFGIAKFADSTQQTREGFIKGKLGYMSPEQASGSALDRRSDVFALGTVLYESLTLRRAFYSDVPQETVARVLQARYQSLRAARPGLPETLYRIVERCLDREPPARFGTCHDVSVALREMLREHQPAAARDLARQLQRLFGQDLAALSERIARATSDASSEAARTPSAPPATVVPVRREASPQPNAPPRRGRWAVLLASFVAGGAAAALLAASRVSSQPSSADAAVATAPETPPGEVVSSAPAVETAPPVETAPATIVPVEPSSAPPTPTMPPRKVSGPMAKTAAPAASPPSSARPTPPRPSASDDGPW